MITFTEADLERLIKCPKRVDRPPAREMRVDRRTRRNDMTLVSTDGKHQFRVFMRQSEAFPEDFSIGLDHHPGEEPGSFLLLRCNGQHGGTREHPHHAYFHVHHAVAADVNAGLKVERRIEPAKEYASFREALLSFCLSVGLDDQQIDTAFPGLAQTRLFTEEEVDL